MLWPSWNCLEWSQHRILLRLNEISQKMVWPALVLNYAIMCIHSFLLFMTHIIKKKTNFSRISLNIRLIMVHGGSRNCFLCCHGNSGEMFCYYFRNRKLEKQGCPLVSVTVTSGLLYVYLGKCHERWVTVHFI